MDNIRVTFLIVFCNLLLHFASSNAASSSTTYNASTEQAAFASSICNSMPYPETCFTTFDLSISININPNILSYLLHSLQTAVSETQKLNRLFSNAKSLGVVEKQRGALQDCNELHQITLTALQRSLNHVKQAADVKAYLSAALTNKITCSEGLESAAGSFLPTLLNSMQSTYKYVSNSLALASKSTPPAGGGNRRLLGLPNWFSRQDRRFLEVGFGGGDDDDDSSPASTITVAQDGSGNFTTLSDAISFAPTNSEDRVIIFVKEGVYEENVEIPTSKPNIMLIGDGNDVTVITGKRSVRDGWTTFRSATVAVSGERFLARDIWFENSAGPEKGQAVAVRVNADFAAFFRCSFTGFQDTLYTHSFRQFYRECDIYGTVDFIFGNAAVVFQASTIVPRRPLPGQSNVITAQGRDDPLEPTGISIQNCTLLPSQDLDAKSTKTYLGRPWRNYSRTVVLESYIGAEVDAAGWLEWPGGGSTFTLYYGEYENNGPGAGTERRVAWQGYHVMTYDEASNFTVSEFIAGDEWLDSTNVPYDDGI